MKTKLTLIVKKEIVEKAKLKAASRGISLSKMFEEVFAKEIQKLIKLLNSSLPEDFLKD